MGLDVTEELHTPVQFPPRPRILVADDQPDVLEALRLLLKHDGYEIEVANSPARVLQFLRSREFDLLLMDLNYARDTTSGQEGMALVRELRAIDPLLPIVAMTAWGSIELAVEAMRKGVSDFILKPWNNSRLLALAREQVKKGTHAARGRTVGRGGEAIS